MLNADLDTRYERLRALEIFLREMHASLEAGNLRDVQNKIGGALFVVQQALTEYDNPDLRNEKKSRA